VQEIMIMDKTTTHCQICGRPIMARTGVIAHHGYLRPTGWHAQTRSCYGARRVPYEVGHDAIDALIPLIEGQQQRSREALETLRREPPAMLIFRTRDGWNRAAGQTYERERPEGFDPANVRPDHRRGSYISLYLAEISDTERSLREMADELVYLRDRRAAWKAPA